MVDPFIGNLDNLGVGSHNGKQEHPEFQRIWQARALCNSCHPELQIFLSSGVPPISLRIPLVFYGTTVCCPSQTGRGQLPFQIVFHVESCGMRPK